MPAIGSATAPEAIDRTGSATEDTAGGTYAITYAAQDTTEVLKLTPSKNGYNFSKVVTNTITLP